MSLSVFSGVGDLVRRRRKSNNEKKNARKKKWMGKPQRQPLRLWKELGEIGSIYDECMAGTDKVFRDMAAVSLMQSLGVGSGD